MAKPRRTPPGFKWQGNKLVPLGGTVYNKATEDWDIATNPPEKETQNQSIITGSDTQDKDPHWSDTSQVGGGGHENAPSSSERIVKEPQPGTPGGDSMMMPNSEIPPGSVSAGGGPSGGGTPPRPRQSDPNQPDYETPEEYEAWAGGGVPHYGVNQGQLEPKKYGKGKGEMAAEGSSPQSGNLRRGIRKLSSSLITPKV